MTLATLPSSELGTSDHRHDVGRFRYDVAEGAWWWSDETYRILGFEPHEVVPTWSLLLSHQHTEDRDEVQEVLETAARTGEAFSNVHRITDARGRERTLSDVGEGRCDPTTRAVTHVVGFHADVTSAVERLGDARATASIHAAAENRAGIEQAKGIVGYALGVDMDEAFATMRTASNHTNVPVRQLAAWVVDAATGPQRDAERVADIVTDLAGL
ncbi:PAS and ANTAR domain-containing protein [Isoptericola sp. NPDC056618]|uniref:PAS and ANTAR domain-containing protein n=1 Tax=unclassified Isoptericola TaxID=2623355 RepID=UPI003646E45A